MSRFRRSSAAPDDAAPAGPVVADAPLTPKEGGKGRPTPKRNESQKRRTGPPVPPPKTQREALKREREAAKQARTSGRAGSEAAMLARDRGPVRALVRDLVDGRRNVGALFLPFAVLIVVGTIVPNPAVQQFTFSLWTAALLLLIVDSVRLGRFVMKSVRGQFGDDLAGDRKRSLLVYAISRSTVMRRMRRPSPRVSSH